METRRTFLNMMGIAVAAVLPFGKSQIAKDAPPLERGRYPVPSREVCITYDRQMQILRNEGQGGINTLVHRILSKGVSVYFEPG